MVHWFSKWVFIRTASMAESKWGSEVLFVCAWEHTNEVKQKKIGNNCFTVLSYGFHTFFTHKHHMIKCVAGTDLWPNTWSEEEESEEEITD